eukprot:1671153-Alexandrium_andersonii.AAC.1
MHMNYCIMLFQATFDTAPNCSEHFRALSFRQFQALSGFSGSLGRSPKVPESARMCPKVLRA